MADDFHDFEFLITHERVIPEWSTGRFHAGRVTRELVEAMRGPVKPGMSLAEAFKDIATGVILIASRKVKAVDGKYDAPMHVGIEDWR